MTSPLHLSGCMEWRTPKRYIKRVRAVLGHIDLDPASCKDANLTVRARQYFTKEENGLSKRWFGKVFCNPPYGRGGRHRSNQQIWVEKMDAEWLAGNFSEGILLVNAVTDRKWFRTLWDRTLCFVDHRIQFDHPDARNDGKSPTHANVFAYYGYNQKLFQAEFKSLGAIVG